MQQLSDFFYLMGVLAVLIISISKYKGALELMPNVAFWLLYIPMLILSIAYPLIRKKEQNLHSHRN